MPEATADIVGTTKANFTFTLNSGTIDSAILEVDGQPDTPLTFTGNEVTVPGLPAGDSTVSLGLEWNPGDNDATIHVGKVFSGSAQDAVPPHTIDAGDTPGFVELFGK